MSLALSKLPNNHKLVEENTLAITQLVPSSLSYPSRRLEPGAVLYEAGQEAKLIYLLKKGLLKVVIPSVMGKDRLIDFYKAGDMVGFAALNGGEHAETVIAAKNSLLLPLDPSFISGKEGLSTYVLLNLAKHLKRTREMVAASELPVGARVAWLLKILSQRFGQQTRNHKMLLPVDLTHEDIASLVHSSRVTVTRVLGELRGEEAVYGGRGAYITDPKRLDVATDQYILGLF